MINNQPKKILYVITQSEFGGAQRYIFDLACHFRDHGCQTGIAAGGDEDGELLKRARKIGLGDYYIKTLRRPVNLYYDCLAFLELIKLFKNSKPDIVHLNSSKAGALGAIAAKMTGVKKVIYTVHGLVLNEPLLPHKKIFYWASEWLSAKFKDKIICVSEYDRKSLLNYKITGDEKIKVTHNGIDLENIRLFDNQNARGKLGLDINEDEIVVGTVANFYKTKGLPYLIEAAREALGLNSSLKFVIIGDGLDRKELEQMIYEYKLQENIILTGTISGAGKYLKAFDIFVLPSIKEGLPYILIEAQAAGVPIIATKTGGNNEIIENGKNGILVDPKNFSKLAEEIINLARNKNKQEELARNGLINVSRFDVKRMIRETERVY